MEAGRLGVVRKHEDSQRKFLCVINGTIRSRFVTYDDYISREKQETTFRYQRNLSQIRKAIVRQRVLNKCMKMRRDVIARSNFSDLYGRYGGCPLDAYSRDIDTYIAARHPKIRRLQKIQSLMDEGIQKGKILDSSTVHNKIDDYFKSNWENDAYLLRVDPRMKLPEPRDFQVSIRKQRKHGPPPLPNIPKSYYTGKKSTTNQPNTGKETISSNKASSSTKIKPVEIRPNVKEVAQNKTMPTPIAKPEHESEAEKPTKQNSDGSLNSESSGQKIEPLEKENTRGSLKLPPVQTNKALVQR